MHTFPVMKYRYHIKKQKATLFKTSQWNPNFLIYFNGLLFMDAFLFLVHIFYISTDHLTGSKGCIIAVNGTCCLHISTHDLCAVLHLTAESSFMLSSVSVPFWLIYHTFPSFMIFLCNIFRLSFYPVPLFYRLPFLFRYSSSTSFDIASQHFQLCSFS
jgi:hypothetical protein